LSALQNQIQYIWAAGKPSVDSHTSLRRFISEDLDGRLREASSPTCSLRVSIRIDLIESSKTIGAGVMGTRPHEVNKFCHMVFEDYCKAKQFNQMLTYHIVGADLCVRPAESIQMWFVS